MSGLWNALIRQKDRSGDGRTKDQIRQHYELEKTLAARLRNASREERLPLYASLYAEYYRVVHPQRKFAPEVITRKVAMQMDFLRPLLKRDTTFLEIGPGNCALAFEVAKHVESVYAVDASDEIVKSLSCPPNFRFLVSSGPSVPMAQKSVTVVYSNQVFEHIHPDDAMEHLKEIHKALAPGGIFICITPNRLSGPHDISAAFDDNATGFHLKEYTNTDLSEMFRQAGFSAISVYFGNRCIRVDSPAFKRVRWLETLPAWLPHSLRKPIVRRLMTKLSLNNVKIVGTKWERGSPLTPQS